MTQIPVGLTRGNSLDKLRHTRSVAYSAELVLLNKHQISGGGAYPDWHPTRHNTYFRLCRMSRDERDECVEPCFSNMADDKDC